MSNDLRRQIEACLTSDLLEESKLVWTYLIACRPTGCGAQMLAKSLGCDVEDALEVLKEEGLAKLVVLHHGGAVWKATRYALAKSKSKSKVSGGPVSVHLKATEFIKVYQRLRKAAMGREMNITPTVGKHFEEVAEWLETNGVSPVAFMRFAIDRSDWLEDRMPFPTPSFLKGQWIRGQWDESRAGGLAATSTKASKHAGTSYGEADTSTKAKLAAAGLEVDGLTEAELRYIETCAATAREVGDVGTVDDRWVPYIDCLMEDG